MKPSLQLKLSQHLALTPQLQQSIRLLQLSTLELEQELEKFGVNFVNPVTNELDPASDNFVFHNGSGNILKRIERTYAKRKISRIVPDSQVVIITILYDGFAV